MPATMARVRALLGANAMAKAGRDLLSWLPQP